MNVIFHAAPKGGGSARGCIRYIEGYAATEKGEDRVAAAREHAVLHDAMDQLPNGGVDQIHVTGKIRPAAVYCNNVTSYSTAALEIDSLAAANGRIRESVAHMTHSFGNDPGTTPERAIEASKAWLKEMGWGHLPVVMAVHCDTEALHVHLGMSRVDNRTMRAVDFTQIHNRSHKAARKVEKAMGLHFDFGNYKIDDDGEIVPTTRQERKIHRRQLAQERAEHRYQRSYERTAADYDATFEKFADRTIAPRIRQALERGEDTGLGRCWNDVHRVAADWGAQIEVDDDGVRWLQELREDGSRGNGRVRCEKLGLDAGKLKLGRYEDRDGAQQHFVDHLRAKPGEIARGVAQEQAVFLVDDIDGWISARVNDYDTAMELRDAALASGGVVRLTSDEDLPVLTTQENIENERTVSRQIRDFSGRKETFDAAIMREVIATYESTKRAEQIERGDQPSFRLSDEQTAPLLGLDRGLVTIAGRSGTGKTTIQELTRLYCERVEMPIVGLTLSQAAAEELTIAGGFMAVNHARARIMESRGDSFIPRNGVVVCDEAAMNATADMREVFRIAAERNSRVLMVYDLRQLSPIDAGQPAAIAQDETVKTGRHFALNQIRRQHGAYQQAVLAMSNAVTAHEEKDQRKLLNQVLDVLEANGWLTWHEDEKEAMEQSLAAYVAARHDGKRLIFTVANKEHNRWANEEARRLLGLDSAKGEREYTTEGGRRKLVAGDRVVFLQNDKRLGGVGVANGYIGDVIECTRYSITVDTMNGKRVTFDPRRYQAWDYGHAAITVHKSQGASVWGNETLPTRGMDLRAFHVAWSRGKEYVGVRLSRRSFADRDDLIDALLDKQGRKYNVRDFEGLDFDKQKKGEMLRVVYESRRDRADKTSDRMKYDSYVEAVLGQRRHAIRVVNKRWEKRLDKARAIVDEVVRRQTLLEQRRKRDRVIRKEMERLTPESFEKFRAQEQQREAAERRRTEDLRERMRVETQRRQSAEAQQREAAERRRTEDLRRDGERGTTRRPDLGISV